MPTITWQLMKAMVMIMIRIMIIRQLLLLLYCCCSWSRSCSCDDNDDDDGNWKSFLRLFFAGLFMKFPRGCAAAQLWKTLIWKLLVNCCGPTAGWSATSSPTPTSTASWERTKNKGRLASGSAIMTAGWQSAKLPALVTLVTGCCLLCPIVLAQLN